MTPDLTFEDVAGNEHVLKEMEELVGYLTDPAKYAGQFNLIFVETILKFMSRDLITHCYWPW